MTLGFLASHRGSNMQAVIDACESGAIAGKPAVLVANNRGAEAILRAERVGMRVHVLNAITHPDFDDLDLAVCQALVGCELIVLAGYMKKLGPRTLGSFRNRNVNIHPSLLPKYGGKGMYGMNVHHAVIATGETITGASVHLVDGEYDQGAVLAQRQILVQPGATPESLAESVLPVEHRLLVETVGMICSGNIPL